MDLSNCIYMRNHNIHNYTSMMHISYADTILQYGYQYSLCREPSQGERDQYYNPIKSGELNFIELCSELKSFKPLSCSFNLSIDDYLVLSKADKSFSSYVNISDIIANISPSNDTKQNLDKQLYDSIYMTNTSLWKDRFPNQIYAWSVDFHGSPSACNIPIYKEIGHLMSFMTCLSFFIKL